MRSQNPKWIITPIFFFLLVFGVRAQVPFIDSFSPISGPVGTPVTIIGANFSSTPSSNIVYFGAVRALVIEANSSSLVVLAPAGATLEPIRVTVAGLRAMAKRPFLVTFGGSHNVQFDVQQDFPFGKLQDVLLGDFNGDGKPDVATETTTDSYVGEFLIAQNLASAGGINASSLATPQEVFATNYTGEYNTSAFRGLVADVDGDGKLDLLETHSGYNGGFILIFQNISSNGILSGDSFAQPITISISNYPGLLPYGFAVADLDGDGRAELIASTSGSLLVFQNVGSPGKIDSNSFAPPIAYFTNQNFSSIGAIQVADLDADGRPDLVCVSPDGPVVIRNIHTHSGIDGQTLGQPIQLSSPLFYPALLQLADLDGDGRLDIIARVGGTNILAYRNLTTGPGLDTNSFGPPGSVVTISQNSPNYGSVQLSIGDLDGDGKLDLVLVDYVYLNNLVVSVCLNGNTPGTITSNLFGRIDFIAYQGEYPQQDVAVADMDGDGRPDVVISRRSNNGANSVKNYLTILRNSTPSAPDVLPIVSISSPTNGALFKPPANVSVSATASDSDGSVLQVSFYSGTNLVAVSTHPPYGFQWTNLGIGTYTMRARALDNLEPVLNFCHISFRA
jgi:hypothetical protein